jgi:hypothetical protein
MRSLFEESTVAWLGSLIEERLLEQPRPTPPQNKPGSSFHALRESCVVLRATTAVVPGSIDARQYGLPRTQAVRLVGVTHPAFGAVLTSRAPA